MASVNVWLVVAVVASSLPYRNTAEQVKLLEQPDLSNKERWNWGAAGGKQGWDAQTSMSGAVESYAVCRVGPSYTAEASWLVSDPIETKEANKLDIHISYFMRKCASLGLTGGNCKDEFDVYFLQTDHDYTSGPDYPGLESFEKVSAMNGSDPSAFSVLVTGKYSFIAFRDNGSCSTLSKVQVMYNVCQEKTLDKSLVTLPRTVAPANDSQTLKVKGNCLEDTVPSTAEELYGICQSNGEWRGSPQQQLGKCLCKAGLMAVGGGCRACPLGQYKDSAAEVNCTVCPPNSVSADDRKSCRCKERFYRLPSEGVQESCTGPPSAPRQLKVAHVNATAVRLTWQPPESFGGRPDVFYDVICKPECEPTPGSECPVDCGDGVSYRPNKEGSRETHVTVANLFSFTHYRFTIEAKNGVSQTAWNTDRVPANSSWVLVRTGEAVPGEPRLFITRLSDTSVDVKWSLRHRNGVIQYYLMTYYREADQSDGVTINTTGTELKIEGLEPGVAYYFKVRAKNRKGLGPFSKEVLLPETLPVSGSMDDMDSVWIIAAAGGGAGFVFIVVLIMVFATIRRKRYRKKAFHEAQEAEETMGLYPSSVESRLYIDPSNYGDPLEALKNFTMELTSASVKVEQPIGMGEFAEVYKGTIKTFDGTETVAIKTLKNGYSKKALEDFLFEASIMGQFDHPHVILLKGVVTKAKPMMIVTEYMDGGSLDSFLKNCNGKLTTLQLMGMARGVASGMAYLASMKFIHRDLAARNILVGYNMLCKVSDFGMSRELMNDNPDSEYQTQGGVIPVRWTAPEAIQHRTFSSASDVWSFGILLWEIMAFGERPYWDWNNFEVMGRVQSGYRLPSPVNCPEVVHNLMLRCWDAERSKRPLFTQVVKRCDELIRSPELLRGSLARLTSPTHTDFSRVQSVRDWLRDIGMDQYVCKFENASYSSLPRVIQLQDNDLQDMGISLIGHRNKIRKSIRAMKKHYDGSEPVAV